MTDHWGNPTTPATPEPQPATSAAPAPPAQQAAYATSPGQTEILTSGGGTGTILAADLPPQRRLGRGKLAAIVAGAVAVAGVGVGAAVAVGALGGGGDQPDKFVPAGAVAYLSVDLDPSLGQKVDALRFLRKFPSAKKSLGSTDDIRQWAFDQITQDDADLSKLSYDRDVKPWIGDRFAVAAVPAGGAGEPDAVVVLQVSDEGKAKTGLAKLMKKPGDGVCSVGGGYAVCAENQSVLTRVRSDAAKKSLAQDDTYSGDVASVGKRGIALAWGDIGKLAALAPSAAGGSFGGMTGFGGSAATGRFVATVRFSGDDVELVGTTRGGTSAIKPGPAGTGVEKLPAGTVAALGSSLDKKAIDQSYARMKSQAQSGGVDIFGAMESQLAQLGFHLPQDLDALFGTRFQVAFGGFAAGGLPQVGLHSNAPAGPAARVLDNLNAQLSQFGAPFTLRHAAGSDGYALALDQAYAKELAANGRLGDQEAFKRAVPDAAHAQAVGYIDFGALAKALRSAGLAKDSQGDLAALESAGFTVRTSGDGTATFHGTLVTR